MQEAAVLCIEQDSYRERPMRHRSLLGHNERRVIQAMQLYESSALLLTRILKLLRKLIPSRDFNCKIPVQLRCFNLPISTKIMI